MSALNKPNFLPYKGKVDGDYLPAADWNGLVGVMEETIGDIIDVVNDLPAGGGSGSSSGDSTPQVLPANDTLTVNGVAATIVNGKVALAASTVENAPTRYILSGVLHGYVEIGVAGDEPVESTEVVLDNAIIVNSQGNVGINYLGEKKSLYLTLSSGTTNYVACLQALQRDDSQPGAINSENGLVIQGAGKLGVLNYGGHGIKAGDIRLTGKPQIYVGAIHDGVHGNKGITIVDGKYYVTGANGQRVNDAFAVSKYESDDSKVVDNPSLLGTPKGQLIVLGGDIYAYNLETDGNVFDAVDTTKKSGFFAYKNAYSIHTDKAKSGVSKGMTVWEPETYFGNAVHNTSAGGWITAPTGGVSNGLSVINPVTTDGKTIVKAGQGSGTAGAPGENEVLDTEYTGERIYNLTGASWTITGYIVGRIKCNTSQTTLTLQNAYIYNPLGPAIEYVPEGSRLQIQLLEDSDVNAVNKQTMSFIVSESTEHPAIVSNNNVEIAAKNGCPCFITNPNFHGVVCSKFGFNNSSGDVVIRNCGKYGIFCTQAYFNSETAGNKKNPGAVIITGSKGNADVYVRKSSKGLKGDFDATQGGTTTNNAGTFAAGVVSAELNMDFGNLCAPVKGHVSYEKALGVVYSDPGAVVFDTDWVFNPGIEMFA